VWLIFDIQELDFLFTFAMICLEDSTIECVRQNNGVRAFASFTSVIGGQFARRGDVSGW
jgi:hypothetical protein